MSFTAVGSFLQAASSGAGTISLNNQAIGNVLLLEFISIDSNANYVNSVTGGGATWAHLGTVFTGTANTKISTIWAGTVTATGAQTASYGITGGGPSIRVAGGEFHSTVGSWALDVQGNLDSADTNTWPSLTPSGSGELYFGFAANGNVASAGSTAGYTYNVTTQGNGAAWNTSVSAASAPVWADSTQLFGSMILLKETGGSESGPFNITLPAPTVSLAGQIGHNSTFTPVLPAPTVSLAGQIGHTSTFNIRLPAPVLTLTGHLPPPPPITVKAGGVPDSGRSPIKKLWLLGW